MGQHRTGERLRTVMVLAVAGIGLGGCGPVVDDLDCHRNRRADGAPPAIQLVQVDEQRSEMAWGALVMNQSDGDESWATAIDGCAAHVWWRPPSDPDNRVIRVHPSTDGDSLFVAEHNREHRPDKGVIFEVDPETEQVLSTTRTNEAHHDFALVDGGEQVAWISWQYLENTWFPNLDADVVTDAVRMAPVGTEGETEQPLFSLYDHTPFEPWWTCSHMNPTDQIPGYAEWSHANSLVFDAEDGRFYLYARYWDTLLAFDRSGRLHWMLGGPRNDFALLGDTELPVHAHLSEVWDGGMLVFDNRNHHESGTSRVVEYAWDEATSEVQEVWSWEDETFVGFLGDAKRLPGGNVLVVQSTEGRMIELTREGEIVWEAQTDGRLSRVDFVPDWPLPR